MSEKENSNNEPDQIISVNPEAVVENIKETSIWLRLVLVLIFLFVFTFTDIILWLIAGIQFLFTIFTKKPNDNLLSLSIKIRKYLSQIIDFVTYSSDLKPFPFSPFPD